MKLSWSSVQEKLKTADRHISEAGKTAGMVLDVVTGGKPSGKKPSPAKIKELKAKATKLKQKTQPGKIIRGKCRCPK